LPISLGISFAAILAFSLIGECWESQLTGRKSSAPEEIGMPENTLLLALLGMLCILWSHALLTALMLTGMFFG